MEVRLNKRPKIKQLFRSLGINSDLSFKALFNPSISKRVLMYYLDELEQQRPPLLDFVANNDKALLTTLIFNNPELGPRQILQLFGFKQALQTITSRELRTMFVHTQARSWHRPYG